MRRFVWLAVVVALVGCDPAPPPPVAETPVGVPPWQKRLNELTALIKPGMSEAAVVQAAGEPSRTKSLSSAGVTLVIWEYDLEAGHRFRVNFDRQNNVARAELASAAKIQ